MTYSLTLKRAFLFINGNNDARISYVPVEDERRKKILTHGR